MNNLFAGIATLVVVLVFVVGCGGTVEKATPTPATEAEEPTSESPLVIDPEQRTISVYATVNGRYKEEPTRHGMNFREGNIGDKSLFASHANMLDFHDALLKLNAERGELVDGHIVGGTEMEISVTWEGADRRYELGEVIEDSTGEELDFQYGGTVTNTMRKFTGCMMCLDSCDVGVTSNTSHPKGITENPDADVALRGKPEVLPEDGTPVVVTFALRG